MAGGRHIEYRLWLNLNDLCEIWYEEARSCLTGRFIKYQILNTRDGGRPPF